MSIILLKNYVKYVRSEDHLGGRSHAMGALIQKIFKPKKII